MTEAERQELTHDQALDAICGCSATVTVLSYEEAIGAYFKLRDLGDPMTISDRLTERDALAEQVEALTREMDEAREALAREIYAGWKMLPRTAPMTQWQPIETAPRDGTEIIGFRPDQGVFVFRWAWMEEFVPKDQNGDPTEDYDDDFACWWHDRWSWMEAELTPTHWMPLPDPPKTEDAQ